MTVTITKRIACENAFMTVYHVRYRDGGEWAVEKRGASRASFVGSEAQAKAKVRNLADDGDTIVLHNKDGSVFKRKTHQDQTGNIMKGVRRKMGDSPFDR